MFTQIVIYGAIVWADNIKLKIAEMELEMIHKLAVVSLIEAIKTCSIPSLEALLHVRAVNLCLG